MTNFLKMHGLGNDFIIFDWRDGGPDQVPAAAARALADRRRGIGCDQILVIRPSARADIRMDILNHDGSASGACGNGTRCVADLVMGSGMKTDTDGVLSIETDGGDLRAWRDGAEIAVDMGPVSTTWDQVPLAGEADTLAVPLGVAGLGDAVCHSLGNPHAVVFVEDAEAVDLDERAPEGGQLLRRERCRGRVARSSAAEPERGATEDAEKHGGIPDGVGLVWECEQLLHPLALDAGLLLARVLVVALGQQRVHVVAECILRIRRTLRSEVILCSRAVLLFA